MRQILNTLYILTPNAYAHLENDTLRIDVERQRSCRCHYTIWGQSYALETYWFPQL